MRYPPRKSIALIATLACFFCNTLIVLAADEKEEDPDKGLPKSGVLSTSISTGYQTNKKVAIPWNKEGAGADAQAPISGSVSRINTKQWQAKVFNNTDDAFSADVAVVQLNANGNTVKRDSFSMRLKPKESLERTVSAVAGSSDGRLELISWKRLTSKKKEEPSAQVPANTEPAEAK